jgi:tetratricopeptide (TPR) repeat protein
VFAAGSPEKQADDASARASHGLALARQRAWPEAEGELRLAVSDRPDVPIYHAQLAAILGIQGKYEEALNHLMKALSLDPTNLDYRREAAAVEWQLGRLDEAAAHLDANLESHPDDKGSLLLLGMVREAQGKYADAVKLLQSQWELVQLQPDRLVALLHTEYECRQAKEAQRVAAVLSSHSGESSWWNGVFRGGQVASAADDPDTAYQLFSTIEKNFPDQGAINFELGNVQLQRGQFARAEQSYQRAAELRPDSPESRLGLAGARLLTGRGEQALSVLEQGIERFPDDARFLIAYANALEQLPEYSEAVYQQRAEKYLRRAISINASSAWAHYLLGQLLVEQSNLKEGIHELETALQCEANFRQAHFALSRAYRRAGRGPEADSQYSAFRQLELSEPGTSNSISSTPAAPREP